MATLLTYQYGSPVDEATVFRAMYAAGDQEKIRREGFSLLDMKRYLESQGYRADGVQVSLDELAEASVPAIALVSDGGYRHFVVVKGKQGGRIVLGDPALGTRIVMREQFESMRVGGIFFVIRSHEGAGALQRAGGLERPAAAPLALWRATRWERSCSASRMAVSERNGRRRESSHRPRHTCLRVARALLAAPRRPHGLGAASIDRWVAVPTARQLRGGSTRFGDRPLRDRATGAHDGVIVARRSWSSPGSNGSRAAGSRTSTWPATWRTGSGRPYRAADLVGVDPASAAPGRATGRASTRTRLRLAGPVRRRGVQTATGSPPGAAPRPSRRPRPRRPLPARRRPRHVRSRFRGQHRTGDCRRRSPTRTPCRRRSRIRPGDTCRDADHHRRDAEQPVGAAFDRLRRVAAAAGHRLDQALSATRLRRALPRTAGNHRRRFRTNRKAQRQLGPGCRRSRRCPATGSGSALASADKRAEAHVPSCSFPYAHPCD